MILFLDFDGVLHTNGDSSEHFSCAPALWGLLRRHPDVRVVFSTGWRFEHPLDELRQLVCANGGEDLADRFIATTPLLRHDVDERSREKDCLAWLAANGKEGARWLAIDDMPSLFTRGTPHFYHVTPKRGLMDYDVERISVLIGRIALAACDER